MAGEEAARVALNSKKEGRLGVQSDFEPIHAGSKS
jgi:hypothetical protein